MTDAFNIPMPDRRGFVEYRHKQFRCLDCGTTWDTNSDDGHILIISPTPNGGHCVTITAAGCTLDHCPVCEEE